MITANANPLVVTDERIYTMLAGNTLERVDQAVIQGTGWAHPHELSPMEVAWCHGVYALISFGGVAGPDCMAEIFSLHFGDIATCNRGFVYLPRAGGRVPIYIPTVAVVYLQSLIIHLQRGRGGGRNRMGDYPIDGFIIPMRDDPRTMATAAELQHAAARFQLWLRNVAEHIGVKISINRLTQLSRARLLQHYSPVVAGAILGLHLYNPAPVGQMEDFPKFRQPLRVETFRPNSSHDTAKLRRGQRCSHAPKHHPSQPTSQLPAILRDLRRIVVAYSRAEKDAARSVRGRIRRNLGVFCRQVDASIAKPANMTWADWYGGHASWSAWQTEHVIALWIAEWLSTMIHKPPNSVEARLNDLLGLIRRLGETPLHSIDTAILTDRLTQAQLSPASRSRLADSLRQFFRFVEMRHGVKPPAIAWWQLYGRREIREQRILTQTNIEEILSGLDITTGADRNVAAGLLVSFYFGLRVHELCALQIGDVWLNSTATVFVWKSKRGRSRFIAGIEIPKPVVEFLQGFLDGRIQLTGNDRGAPVLVNSNGKRFSRQQLGRRLLRAMETAGTEIASGHHTLAVVHAIRHACANRWWALGTPLIEIARRLGHRSAETTVREYLHGLAFSHAEQLHEAKWEVIPLSATLMATLLGVTDRYLRRWRAEQNSSHHTIEVVAPQPDERQPNAHAIDGPPFTWETARRLLDTWITLAGGNSTR